MLYKLSIFYNLGSHSELIELLQKQLAEKDAQIEELKQSRLKRTIRPRIEEV